MRRALLALVFAAVTLTSCGSDEAARAATSFTWETTLDQGGFGYVLTVDGTVGDGHAAYSLQVQPLVPRAGNGSDDAIAALAGIAVNGLADAGVDTSLGTIDADGETLVRVLGDERWYRNPWVLAEVPDAVGSAEWVRVVGDDAVLADLATSVLNERYDEALRRLLELVRTGEPVTAPAAQAGSELDETLTPWIGLVGPAYRIGADAGRTGDADEGEVSWTDTATGEDGRTTTMAGRVRWSTTGAEAPEPPSAAVDVDEVTAVLGS